MPVKKLPPAVPSWSTPPLCRPLTCAAMSAAVASSLSITPGQVELSPTRTAPIRPPGTSTAAFRLPVRPTVLPGPPALDVGQGAGRAGVQRQRGGPFPSHDGGAADEDVDGAELPGADGAAGELGEPDDEGVALVEQLVGGLARGGALADRRVELGDGGRGLVDLLDRSSRALCWSFQACSTPAAAAPRESVTPRALCSTWVRARLAAGVVGQVLEGGPHLRQPVRQPGVAGLAERDLQPGVGRALHVHELRGGTFGADAGGDQLVGDPLQVGDPDARARAVPAREQRRPGRQRVGGVHDHALARVAGGVGVGHVRPGGVQAVALGHQPGQGGVQSCEARHQSASSTSRPALWRGRVRDAAGP